MEADTDKENIAGVSKKKNELHHLKMAVDANISAAHIETESRRKKKKKSDHHAGFFFSFSFFMCAVMYDNELIGIEEAVEKLQWFCVFLSFIILCFIMLANVFSSLFWNMWIVNTCLLSE